MDGWSWYPKEHNRKHPLRFYSGTQFDLIPFFGECAAYKKLLKELLKVKEIKKKK
jgi:hypothetical protein